MASNLQAAERACALEMRGGMSSAASMNAYAVVSERASVLLSSIILDAVTPKEAWATQPPKKKS